MNIFIEIIFIAIIVVSVWSGYKKGLVMTLGSILVIIVSLFMGNLLSDTFSHEASPVIHPFVTGYMEGTEGTFTEAYIEVAGSAGTMSVDDTLALHPEYREDIAKISFMNMGIYEKIATQMAATTLEISDETGVAFSSIVVDVMCDTITYVIGFLIFFAIILILLTVLGNISNLSFKIPNMEKVNVIGGLVASIGVAFLFCSLTAWMLGHCGLLIPEEELGGIFPKMFLEINFLSDYLGV